MSTVTVSTCNISNRCAKDFMYKWFISGFEKKQQPRCVHVIHTPQLRVGTHPFVHRNRQEPIRELKRECDFSVIWSPLASQPIKPGIRSAQKGCGCGRWSLNSDVMYGNRVFFYILSLPCSIGYPILDLDIARPSLLTDVTPHSNTTLLT